MHGSRWPRGEERSWEGSTSSGCTGWDLAAECGSWLTLWIELPLIGYWWNCRGVWCIAEWKQFLSPFPFYGMNSRVSIQVWQLIRMGAVQKHLCHRRNLGLDFHPTSLRQCSKQKFEDTIIIWMLMKYISICIHTCISESISNWIGNEI